MNKYLDKINQHLCPLEGLEGGKKLVKESSLYQPLPKGSESIPDHLNVFLEKIADAIQEHQQRVVNRIEREGGVIAYHSMGSGKTRTALEAIADQQKRYPHKHHYFIAPASLTSNVEDEIKKHNIKIDKSHFHVTTYDKAVNRADAINKQDLGLVVVDEAHKLRNTGTQRHQGVGSILEHAHRRLLLTGTMNYNKPADVAPLVNLASGKNLLPEDHKKFEETFLERRKDPAPFLRRVLLNEPPKEHIVLKNKKELKRHLHKYVDTYDSRVEQPEKFPERHDKTIEVPMSEEQNRYYKYMEGQLPFMVRMKIHHGLPLDKKESSQLNAFATGVRQIANTHAPFVKDKNRDDVITPKIKGAVDSMEKGVKSDKNFRGIVYSNFLDAGMNPYSAELKRRGIEHRVYHGGLSQKEKDQAVADYNEGRAPVLLFSGAGGEGLNLKGTRKIQVLDPAFNKARTEQAIARGIRYGSHDHLPPEQRKVEVEHYLSRFPDSVLGKPKNKTIDQYLYHLSDTKDNVHEQIRQLAS